MAWNKSLSPRSPHDRQPGDKRARLEQRGKLPTFGTVLQGIAVPRKADVEDAAFLEVLRLAALVLGLMQTVRGAVGQGQALARHPGRVAVEKEIRFRHLLADSGQDLLAVVVVGVAVEVATMPIHVSGGGHADADVEVVLPAEYLHKEVAGQVDVHNVPLQVTHGLVHELTLVIEGYLTEALRIEVPERLENGAPIPSYLAALRHRTHLQHVVIQEWPANGDVVCRGQAVGIGRRQVAGLHQNLAGAHHPDFALAEKIRLGIVERRNVRVAPDEARAERGRRDAEVLGRTGALAFALLVHQHEGLRHGLVQDVRRIILGPLHTLAAGHVAVALVVDVLEAGGVAAGGDALLLAALALELAAPGLLGLAPAPLEVHQARLAVEGLEGRRHRRLRGRRRRRLRRRRGSRGAAAEADGGAAISLLSDRPRGLPSTTVVDGAPGMVRSAAATTTKMRAQQPPASRGT
mmetsp:Transcript_30504/g.101417  ORF Transcript_30504/g.101417 Transcript_30504/m.101417 type:complete len:463 (-) Transcript_30504:316-1704(-)